MISHLPPVVPPVRDPSNNAGEDHPMRVVTRQVAFEPGGWTPQRRAKVRALFDDLAVEWHTRRRPEHRATLDDALSRGLAAPPRPVRRSTCVEVGSGTGFSSPVLAEHFDMVIAADLSAEMLRRAPVGPAHRVQADASSLPARDSSIDAAVLINALLFPAELDRVVAPEGVVMWVNTAGSGTPIHLPASDVARALPGRWDGVASQAGPGTWCVVWRAIR